MDPFVKGLIAILCGLGMIVANALLMYLNISQLAIYAISHPTYNPYWWLVVYTFIFILFNLGGTYLIVMGWRKMHQKDEGL
jgi:hypothetical protein